MRVYVRESRARREYTCGYCASTIERGAVYYRREPYPSDKTRRGALVQQVCFACVSGGASLSQPLPTRSRPWPPPPGTLPYEAIGDGDVFYSVSASPVPLSSRLELLEDLFPGLWVPPKTVHIEIVRHEAARIFDGVARFGDLRSIAPRQLEELLAEALRRQGFEVWLTPRGHDGGRDVIAAQPGELPILLVAEAKKMELVDPLYLRSLVGVRDRDKANMALLATTGRFSDDTRQEAMSTWRRQVQLKDGDEMVAWIRRLAGRR